MKDLSPDFDRFSEIYAEEKCQFVYLTIPSNDSTPVSVAQRFYKKQSHICLLESVEKVTNKVTNRSRYSCIAMQPNMVWKCDKDGSVSEIDKDGAIFSSDCDPIDSLKSFQQNFDVDLSKEMPSMASGIFGYMGYDMVRHMEKITDNNEDNLNIPEGVFFRPEIILIFDSLKNEIIIVNYVEFDEDVECKNAYNKVTYLINDVISEIEKSVGENSHKNINSLIDSCYNNEIDFTKIKSNQTKKDFCHSVEKAKEYINAGDIFQVVLSQRFSIPFDKDSFDLYKTLREVNPSPYSFYLKIDDFVLVGSSPETLVKVEDSIMTVRPIAGTRWRGGDAAADKRLADDLLADKKELAEHLMLLDLGRNDIGRVCEIGSVKVTEKMSIDYYSHVMHIVSKVQGKMRNDFSPIDALKAGFPAGTVSGAPKIRAMEIIDELESERRNFYAGAVGYISANGDMDTCIALRTGLIKDGVFYVQAGGGIVADSNPESEYEESQNKAKALLLAAQIVKEQS